MKRVLDRIRSGRLGLVGIILFVLIVLVVAHALVMGAGHVDEACGSCVVVVAAGLAAVVALTPRRVSQALVGQVRWTSSVATPTHPPLRSLLLRSAVLRL